MSPVHIQVGWDPRPQYRHAPNRAAIYMDVWL